MRESISKTIDDGGPAFPFVETDPRCGTRVHGGMSLLHWFAGQALANSAIAHSGLDEDATATVCRSQAIAMLKALERINAGKS